MATTTNRKLEDEVIARDVLLERARRGLILQVLHHLERVEEDVLRQLSLIDPTLPKTMAGRQARLARLLAEVQLSVERYSSALTHDFVPDLATLAKDEAALNVRMLAELPPVSLGTVAPATATLVAAVRSRPFQGRLLREWVSEHPVAVRMRLRNAIRMGVSQGETIDQITRRVRGTAKLGFSDGIIEVNRRGAEAMVRTAVSHTVAAARQVTYEANSDLIKGVRWVSTLDSRTSETCRGLDGQVFPIDSGPRPPAHINCRSSTVPILRSWEELGIDLEEAPEGTRASMDGQVPANQTYDQWLRKRPHDFQDEVLGMTKAALYREGGLTLDRFIDSSGKSYNLDQLRKREPKAFHAAGLD